MTFQTGQNQSFTRDTNLNIIIKSFLKKDMSRVDISRTFDLSKPTASKIVTELESLDLIRSGEEDTRTATPGVKAIKYKLNKNMGLLAVIDLSTVECKVLVFNFGGDCLAQTKITDKELITRTDIVNLCDALDGLLSAASIAEYSLLSVCMAIPCAVNRNSGKIYWSARFNIDESFDLYDFLKKRYSQAQIIIKNDVQLMLLGETNKGLLENGKNPYAMLIYIDAGLGGGLYMNGALEGGAEGTAGDFGFLPYYDDGETFLLDSVISINAMKKRIKKEIADGAITSLREVERLHFRDIEKAYLGGDAYTVNVIETTARKAANALKTLIEILNIPFLIISGRITRLGNAYKDILTAELKPHFPSLEVSYSTLGDSAINEGSIMVSRDAIIKEKITNRLGKLN